MRVVLLMFGWIKKPFSPSVVGALLAFGILTGGIPAAYGVTNLVWSDEFSGSSSNLDVTKWGFDLGNSSTISGSGWGNQEKQTFTSRTNNAFVANGLLHIVTINDQGGSFPYSSARLRTLGLFSMTYGRVEFRAKLPDHGKYWWPALWMLATNYSGLANVTNQWPRCGEIDVMESKGSTPGNVLGTLHKDSSGSPGIDAADGGQFNFPAGDGTTNFHTYVLSWSTNKITFAVDNNAPYKTITSWTSSIGPFPTPFNHPFYIIMNLAVGGTFFPDNPSVATINASNTFPAEVDIDYVRVYQDVPPLLVKGVSPTNGCMNGGAPITISGSNFLSGATVTIGGVPATSVVFVNTNTLTAVTPTNSAGAMNVAVQMQYISPTGTNTLTGTLTNAFTYTPAPSFGGLSGATPAINAATLTWSAASGTAPITYKVFEATSSGGENYGSPVLTTNSLSAFITPLYPGSNSPITYFFVTRAMDGCGNSDTNTIEQSLQPLLNPTQDQDSDGMSNGFEQKYGLNSFGAADGAADGDGDGFTNLQEFQAGTDPTNSASAFRITSITQVSSTNILITWMTGIGKTNALERTAGAAGSYSNNFSAIFTVTNTVGTSTNYLDAGAVTNSLLRFYRIRLVP